MRTYSCEIDSKGSERNSATPRVRNAHEKRHQVALEKDRRDAINKSNS